MPGHSRAQTPQTSLHVFELLHKENGLQKVTLFCRLDIFLEVTECATDIIVEFRFRPIN